jgi:hypothetical protein
LTELFATLPIEDPHVTLENAEHLTEPATKLSRAASELHTYNRLIATFIPYHGEHWRDRDPIASVSCQSEVNQVVSKRAVKKQKQWTKRGAHLLLQMRPMVLNGKSDQMFIASCSSFGKIRIKQKLE